MDLFCGKGSTESMDSQKAISMWKFKLHDISNAATKIRQA